METRTITISVDAEVAQAYESASTARQRKLDAILNLKLREVTRQRRTLEEIMNDISDKAQARGLTPEILESILNEQ
ncbi:hypothetical protein [Iningainema tapete]|uniref:Uncharacterized protein n=1 Tax=Iningainema tapete BLCC-T55 TaxID=2748662 RepID=A0A8J6XEZ2_9CYAN|nr:hypothetical protein [Iningainema tapete]MBD2774384.1 hypothetical protein [Iningainema tapete BLCC-T55]